MELRDYQKQCVETVIREAKKGVSKQLLVLATGAGKAQPNDSLIVTNHGYKKIGELKLRDWIYSQNGMTTIVTGIFPQGKKLCYKVTFSDNTFTECCEDHLWAVQTRFDKNRVRGYKIKSTKDLLGDLLLKNGDKKWFIPVNDPVQFSTKELPITPYLLGAILGDGGIKYQLIFTNSDKEILNRVQKELRDYSYDLKYCDRYDYRMSSNGKWGALKNKLVNLNLFGKGSKDKFIPKEYLRGDISQRLNLLKGLMDTDGSVSKRNGTGEFCTVSRKLAEDVCELVRSLGGVTSIRTKKTNSKLGMCFRITVNIPFNPFHLKRKAELYNLNTKYGRTKAITGIKNIGYKESTCIKVSNKSELYLTNDYIVTHNTVIFSQFPSLVRDKGKKTLILAHREELLEQAKEKLLSIDPTLKVGIEQAKNHVEEDVDVVVASVPTLGRENSERIKKFNPDDFGLVIVDESHHVSAKSYINILKYFGVLKKVNDVPGKVLLGVTATPNRSDNQGLDKIFDKITFNYSLRDGIEQGYLSNIKAFFIDTASDISSVSVSKGDFSESELAEVINTDARNKLIVDSYIEFVPGSKALCFAVNVEHAIDLTSYFKKVGIHAEYILGSTAKEDRSRLLAEFKRGEFKVLINVGCFLEGFDEPSIEAILMARPTKSSVVYSQIVGRGTRLFPGKEALMLLDFVDNTGKNQVASLPSLFGLPKLKSNKKGLKITELIYGAEKILEANPSYNVSNIEDWDTGTIDKIVREVDIFAQAQLPVDVQKFSKFSWTPFGKGYKISFPGVKEQDGVQRRHQLIIEQDILRNQTLILEIFQECVPDFRNNYQKWNRIQDTIMDSQPTLESIFAVADKWISENKPEFSKMFNQNSSWRKDAPSDKQLATLKKFKIPVPVGLTRGHASVLLAKAFEERRKRF